MIHRETPLVLENTKKLTIDFFLLIVLVAAGVVEVAAVLDLVDELAKLLVRGADHLLLPSLQETNQMLRRCAQLVVVPATRE